MPREVSLQVAEDMTGLPSGLIPANVQLQNEPVVAAAATRDVLMTNFGSEGTNGFGICGGFRNSCRACSGRMQKRGRSKLPSLTMELACIISNPAVGQTAPASLPCSIRQAKQRPDSIRLTILETLPGINYGHPQHSE